VINCGGIAEKNPLLMQIYADVIGREMKIARSQIYADVIGREMKIARSAQSCALGSAIAGAVVAGKKAGGYDNFADAQAAMCGVKETTYKPDSKNNKVYQQLYLLYKQLHDAFGLESFSGKMANVMKQLLDIKDKANR
jgi:L-ribulokinase